MEIETIFNLVDKYDALPLECDGLTRVISYVLAQNGIQHDVYFGHACVFVDGDDEDSDLVNPHFWIKCGDLTIDYRLRRWTGPHAPHGIFKEGRVEYTGEIIKLYTSETVFGILTNSFKEENNG